MHNYGGAVRRIRVRDDEGDIRNGWLFVPYKPKSGLYFGGPQIRVEFDPAHLEVIWDLLPARPVEDFPPPSL
jgi:hypothetical protein